MWIATLILGNEIQPIESQIVAEVKTLNSLLALLKKDGHLLAELYQPYSTLEIHYRKD